MSSVSLAPVQLAILALVVGVSVWLLRRNLWRAVLYLLPRTMNVEEDAPADAKLRLPEQLLTWAAELERHGLKFIGAHLEEPRFGKPLLCFDYASAEAHTFASLFLDAEGEPRAELLTPLEKGGFVRTANYRRSAYEAPGYFSGYLDNVPLERVLVAHQRRVVALGPAREGWDVAARVAAGKAWYGSDGAARELKQLHQQGLMWTFGAVIVFGLGVVTLIDAL
jgi:hypothetical protein